MTFDGLPERLDGFDQYYVNELKPILDDLEVKRRKARSQFYKAVCAAIVVLIPLANVINNSDIMFIVGIPTILILGYFYRKMLVFRKQAKLAIMPEICRHFDMEYIPTPHNGATTEYKELSLIPGYDEKKLEDGVVGEIDGVDFNLFEATLVTVHEDSEGSTTRTTVFKGLLGKFEFHKNFTSTTLISKDLTSFGNFLTGWTSKGNRVKLEDPKFENEFEVYSTDQIEARYLLTPSFMERILKLSRFPKIDDIELAFCRGHLFMAIKRSAQYLEGDGYDLNDPQHISSNIKDIASIFDIVKELNLTLETKI